MVSVDFLPICDLLFNFISVASYFCDVAFDMIVAYTFYKDRDKENGLFYIWFLIIICSIIISLIICQTLSIIWFIEDEEQENRSKITKILFYTSHFFQCGVLWRYSKLLFLPMGSAIPLVKREMRNLCVLRMVHGFVQALPVLLTQGYLYATVKRDHMGDVNNVSLVLSLFSVCWSLASFNKNIRSTDIHKLVLTWIGVIFQLIWRFGTVTARILALVFFAAAYKNWIFLVVALHWLCMFLWNLIQTWDSNVMGKTARSKLCWSFILSYVHNFAYLNVDDQSGTKLKMAIYYIETLIENILLVCLWITSTEAKFDEQLSSHKTDVLLTVIFAYLGGLFFMLLYYRLFHTSKISSAFTRDEVEASNSKPSQNTKHSSSHQDKMAMTEYSNNQAVFNCMLNPALKKKKKIPSVLPPPPNGMVSSNNKATTPFWKEPLPERSTTPHEEIRQKLQTKRESQQKQLQLIQNEIRSGHLARPHLVPPPSQNVHRDPGVKHQPYLYINDPLNDSSGDQGDVDSGDDGMAHHRRYPPSSSDNNPSYQQQSYYHKRRQMQSRQYETPL